MNTLQELMKSAAPAATYDPAAFIVTADQIDAMISQAEQRLNERIEQFNAETDPLEQKQRAYQINYERGRIRALKDVRHAAYVNGGYRQE